MDDKEWEASAESASRKKRLTEKWPHPKTGELVDWDQWADGLVEGHVRTLNEEAKKEEK
jgi:hypothetical protein